MPPRVCIYNECGGAFNERRRGGDLADQPLRLGVTGGAGSGKSVVCGRLGCHGVRVVAADELARRAVMPGMPAYERIVSYFGRSILNPDGTIDRSKLRGIIVRDKEKKAALEGFVHPEVSRLMEEAYAEAHRSGDSLVAMEVPLLFETGMEGYFDCIVTVHVEREERIRRLMGRDRISREEACALMRIQWPEEEKCRKADFVIDNSGPLADTLEAVDRLYKDLSGR